MYMVSSFAFVVVNWILVGNIKNNFFFFFLLHREANEDVQVMKGQKKSNIICEWRISCVT